MPARANLTGKTFGNCKFIEDIAPLNGARRAKWLCLRCGTEFEAATKHIIHFRIKSCKCFKVKRTKECMTTHGHTVGRKFTHTYNTWAGMRQRCNYDGHIGYENYKGRGIHHSNAWADFGTFLAEMGPGKKGWTIERMDNNGNYELWNCVWATRTRQNRNKRNTRYVTVEGIQYCLAEACEKFGLDYGVVRMRLHLGWPDEKALFTPVKVRRVISPVIVRA